MLVDENIVGKLAEQTDVAEVPKENPEANGDLLVCQLDPNKVELTPLLEITGLTSEEEAEVPSPKVVPELKAFDAELEEGNNELPEENVPLAEGLDEGNDKLLEENSVFPISPNDGDDGEEPNRTDCV